MAAPQQIAEPELTVLAPPRPAYRRKRYLLPFAISAATALVGAIALFAGGTVGLPLQRVVVITGKLASKAEFFTDEVVRRELMAHGIQVHITKAGSRAVAMGDVDQYDFVFPSGQPAALLIKEQRQAERKFAKVHKPFFSPIVFGTYREYAEALLTRLRGEPSSDDKKLYFSVDMAKLVDLMRAGTRWSDLDHEPSLDNGNQVLVQTPDVCSANSAATYLGLLAFVVNGQRPPVDETEALALADQVKPFLVGQGLPGDDMSMQYLAPEGRGLAPVAVFYEHQYLAHQIRHVRQNGRSDTNRVLIYPEAQLQTVPEYIALTPDGDRLGQLISNDPALKQRALELGFRVFEPDGSLSAGRLAEHLDSLGLPAPDSGVSDTETFLPPLPLLEKMIERVGGCR
ncbi:hypothetical protein [Actinosynnema mirum]|uniref:Uncharacterized protein n=2 Tax=Actinosynnema TaxID=40566 RepID=C6WBI0_ACTMD|nr:hypothetical protein [Actinosynnema mirum]ACU35548.1 hypothetical protein Amir_1599 [Actinosynnema mirum DSM 43827]AXX28929.1 hypothetical protein APASM_1564 [Actinosynnema pretiosum subsp. pretiosum]